MTHMNETEHQLTIPSVDLAALDDLASAMLRCLPRPLAIGLVGTLGTGKTTFAQAIARAAGIDVADVTSPTFTLLQTYHGSVVLHHLDAYRVADEEEFLQLGVDELFEDERAWTLVEWADRVRDVLPTETLWIELDHGDSDDTRTVRLHSSHSELEQPLKQLQTELA